MIALVFLREALAGVLEKRPDGTFRFTYDKDYLLMGMPISLSLPLQEEPHDSEHLHGFFSGLLSEGWLRHVQSQSQRIDERDEFSLLLNNGLDLPGAVSVKPETPE